MPKNNQQNEEKQKEEKEELKIYNESASGKIENQNQSHNVIKEARRNIKK